jgi:hypothetical protein
MINFIKDNRFATFLDRLATISRNQTSDEYIDLSPNDLFDGDRGIVLVKNGSDILYRNNDDSEFINLSSLFPYIVEPRKVLLTQGINQRVTWIKNSTSKQKTWKFLGYICPFDVACPACYYSA